MSAMDGVPKPGPDGLRVYGGSNRLNHTKENPALCAVQVHVYTSRYSTWHQCTRKRGLGPGGLYCKQHAPVETRVTAYKVVEYNDDVEAVEVGEVTGHMVRLLNGRREPVATRWHRWFRTELEAREHLLERWTREAAAAQQKLDAANKRLAKARKEWGV